MAKLAHAIWLASSFRGSSVEELRAYILALPLLKRITSTSVSMAVNTKDANTNPEMSMKGYEKLSVRKELGLVEGGHYEVLGKKLDPLLEKQIALLKRTLCNE